MKIIRTKYTWGEHTKRTWNTRNGWFYVQTGGDIYAFFLQLGNFSITWERKYKEIGR